MSRCKQRSCPSREEEEKDQSPSPVQEGEEAADQERTEDAAENLRPEGEEEPGMHAMSVLSPADWQGMGREGVCVP